jgi:response regulator of citrate/malate metabolism
MSSLLEGELEQAMIDAIEAGLPITRALEHVGISKDTWRRHMENCRRCAELEPRNGHALKLPIVQRIVELGDEGLSGVEIAERLGLHCNTTQKYLRLARQEDRDAHQRQA